jgi:long-subunit fatty acid transport protein
VFCTAAPLIAGAQQHPDVTSIGNGARALGLSHATTAVTEDVTSIGWNPAGLSYLERRELVFVGRLLILGTSASVTDLSPAFPRYSGAGEITGALDPIEFVGGAVPTKVFGRAVTAGIAYRRFTEGVRAGTFETRYQETNGRYKGSTLFSTKGGVRAVSPSLAVEVTPRIRVGVTANLLSGSETYTVRPPAPGTVYSAREIDYSGLAFEAGALVTVREHLRIGVHATLPHERTLRFDNDTTTRNVTRTAPLSVALGMMLSISDRTRISADLRHAPWSEARYEERASGDTVASPVGVNDANSIHFGYERDISNEARDAKLRLGAFVRRTTARDLKGRAISAYGVSGGRSWIFDRVGVDLGMMYARSSLWTQSETSALRTDLRQHDFLFSVGLRRFF